MNIVSLARFAEDMANKALECLSKIEGSFSFVIFDEAQHRVLAARDQAGTQVIDCADNTFWSRFQSLFCCCLVALQSFDSFQVCYSFVHHAAPVPLLIRRIR